MSTPNNDLERLRIEYAERDCREADSDLYSLFNTSHLFTIHQRQRAIIKLMRRNALNPLGNLRILELGCGRGNALLEFMTYGAMPERLQGTDLLPNRVMDAHTRLPHLPLTCADGQHLPYKSGVFDFVFQFQVFSSILDDAIKVNLAREMLRVLKPDGIIMWYDFWLNPSNPQAKGIRPREVKNLFPNCHFEFRRITLAPPIARRLTNRFWIACLLLERMLLFNAYYLAVVQPVS